MGIPSYFSYILKNHANILRGLYDLKKEGVLFHHLFMDCNSIIYESYHECCKTMVSIPDEAAFEYGLCDKVICKIEKYVETIQPSKTVFIAFDGVAPFAKMEQQRTRRHKTCFLSTLSANKTDLGWNTSKITPGTDFMRLLSERITSHFAPKKRSNKTVKVIVSTSNDPGEGEHKMFQAIRDMKGVSEENAAIYGLDSDLIMLSVFHAAMFKRLFIFRETPAFGILGEGKTESMCYMDMHLFCQSILTEMTGEQNACVTNVRIYDYIFMCFFLGNDFLPHFPALNIRTHGIDILMTTYRKYMGDRGFINDDKTIDWSRVSIFIGELAKMEHGLIISEYEAREKWAKYKWPAVTDEEKDWAFQNTPVIYRQEELYIHPASSGWEMRYYKTLFHGCEVFSKDSICSNYLEGLEWVFTYYTKGCVDWRWKYNYHYPPLLGDLCRNVPVASHRYFSKCRTEPFLPDAQLAYVLPKAHHHLLSDTMREKIVHQYEDCYPDRPIFQWTFCRYFWESHVVLPPIPIEQLSV